jgi:hypothetical protein
MGKNVVLPKIMNLSLKLIILVSLEYIINRKRLFEIFHWNSVFYSIQLFIQSLSTLVLGISNVITQNDCDVEWLDRQSWLWCPFYAIQRVIFLEFSVNLSLFLHCDNSLVWLLMIPTFSTEFDKVYLNSIKFFNIDIGWSYFGLFDVLILLCCSFHECFIVK